MKYSYKCILLTILNSVFLFFYSFSQTTPSWAWAKSASDSNNQWGNSIETDDFGNIYVSDTFYNSITLDSVTLNDNGLSDIFLAKYNSNGTLLWSKGIGGNNNEGIYWNSIISDSTGNIYMTGTFCSDSISFATVTLYSSGSLCDMYTVKFDTNGNVLWAKGTGNNGWGQAIIGDKSDNIFITGQSNSTNFIFDTISLSTSNLHFYILKCDINGNALWAKSAGGDHFNVPTSMGTDNSNNLYVTGYFTGDSIVFDSLILYNHNTLNNRDIFIAKYNSSGNLLWAKSLGGNKADEGIDIIIDSSENIYVTGDFWSDSIAFDYFILHKSSALSFSSDMFLVKYDTSGTVVWAKNTTGANNVFANSLNTDDTGHIYLAGNFEGDSIVFDNLTLNNLGEKDIFLTKYDELGNVIWIKGAGGLNDDNVNSLCLDDFGSIYLSGFFQSSTINFGSILLTNYDSSASSSDAFIAKLDVATGIADLQSSVFHLKFFPNPFTTQSKLTFKNSNKETFLFTLYDITGRVTETFSTTSDEIILSKGIKQAGVYMFNLTNGKNEERWSGKVIITN